MPQLTQESYDELAAFFILIGGGYRNPIDTGNANRREMKRIMEILERDANIDNLLQLIGVTWSTPKDLESQIDLMADVKKRTPKPVMYIIPFSSPEEMRRARDITRKLQERGIPTFPTMERGAFALRRTLDYYSFKSSIGS